MIMKDKLLQGLLERCTESQPLEWRLELWASDFFSKLNEEEATKWPESLIEGHIRLLGDGEFVELRHSADRACIIRVTLAGHQLLEKMKKMNVIRDNPFLRG